ncbi:hypothetical protein FHN55_13425 [Streptomyces sp. NP160]|uniref:WapI family immunity protein n=1 Tax=Streptomyces sp. NP160 TaxID=2586637 RepID=UPI001117B9E2|nr:hypothetical protein [Streptomyces sp. NP160]TNM64523.1 hypothetical protein FHN55_13425 [Streptomyces sp. NP160]
MLLGSDGGVHVQLDVVGYQFPDAVVDDDDGPDWDANWLVVSGRVRAAGGETWPFCDPGLTTWEAAEVAAWLERAARGEVTAVQAAGGPEDEVDDEADERPFWWDVLRERGWLVFLEPCLSLGVSGAGRRAGAGGSGVPTVRVLVGLGAEWAPPPLPAEAHPWRCVELEVPPDQLIRAAEDLRADLSAYPPR